MNNYREIPDDDSFFDKIPLRSISYSIDRDDRLSDYQIRKKIDPETGKSDLYVLGKNAVGVIVYLATQNSVNRPVALWILRNERQDEVFLKRFFYDAEVTAHLEHPNIAPVYELGKTHDQKFFYTTKYIQGTPWDNTIRSNSIEENLEIFGKLCDAIAFAHSKDILHMDIKPDNVQLGEFGEVYAVDWGVANDLKRPDSLLCAGTWQWISPEVARGEKSRIGKGSDIYLLGGILFQIVTGHHPRLPRDPSEKMPVEDLRNAAFKNIIQPTKCKDPLVAVALKALATDPKDRYAKVKDLQDAIKSEQAKISVKLRTQRFKLLWNAFMVSLILATGIFGSLWLQSEQARQKETKKRDGAVTARNEAVDAQHKEEIAK
ncbi:MAG: serine/threonine protein kinase [Planctomycetaceae bacterium]|jgi:serine/threonine protein kinase|nr:serine/threonine protein kinase [Planctomycetaceae bacterium]